MTVFEGKYCGGARGHVRKELRAKRDVEEEQESQDIVEKLFG